MFEQFASNIIGLFVYLICFGGFHFLVFSPILKKCDIRADNSHLSHEAQNSYHYIVFVKYQHVEIIIKRIISVFLSVKMRAEMVKIDINSSVFVNAKQ